MKLSVSNIAWKQHDDPSILKLLRANQVSGIEIAPTKIWNNWEGVSLGEASLYKQFMAGEGFELSAIQAMLYGKPELKVFDRDSHAAFCDHIKLVADIANNFGAKVLVFGSPKNRVRGKLKLEQATPIAVDFFRTVGEICRERGVVIGLEHNPPAYGCDFITNVEDAKELVKLVNHPGFKLHLDAAGIHMTGDEIGTTVQNAGEIVHYHISEPMLAPIIGGVVDQKEGISALKRINYENWVSVEMREPATEDLFENSISFVKELAFNTGA